VLPRLRLQAGLESEPRLVIAEAEPSCGNRSRQLIESQLRLRSRSSRPHSVSSMPVLITTAPPLCLFHLFFPSGCRFKRRRTDTCSYSCPFRLSSDIPEAVHFYTGGGNARQIQVPQIAPPTFMAQQVPVGPACPKEMRKAITTGPSSSKESWMIASNKRCPSS